MKNGRKDRIGCKKNCPYKRGEIMNDQVTSAFPLPIFGSEEFWNSYDKFCLPDHLKEFIENGTSPRASEMCKIMEAAHRSRAIHHLTRLERGWKIHKAWLTLRNAPIRNFEGDFAFSMRTGDVILVEWGWDRDIIITHNPIPEFIRGYLLSGKWDEMVGLFMPLFDRPTIVKCIELRIAKSVREVLAKSEEEARVWQWY